MEETPNIGLEIFGWNDQYDVRKYNVNNEKIDAATGNLDKLKTNDKSNIVNAVNELKSDITSNTDVLEEAISETGTGVNLINTKIGDKTDLSGLATIFARLGLLYDEISKKSSGKMSWYTPGTYTWRVPAHVREISVTGCGGGGACIIDKKFSVTPNSILTITVGKGGEGTTISPGGDGESSSISGLVTLNGGTGGGATQGKAGGISGGDGGDASIPAGVGLGGGSSFANIAFAPGGAGIGGGGSGGTYRGGDGGIGAGGGGGYTHSTGGARGGNGGNGCIIIEW